MEMNLVCMIDKVTYNRTEPFITVNKNDAWSIVDILNSNEKTVTIDGTKYPYYRVGTTIPYFTVTPDDSFDIKEHNIQKGGLEVLKEYLNTRKISTINANIKPELRDCITLNVDRLLSILKLIETMNEED